MIKLFTTQYQSLTVTSKSKVIHCKSSGFTLIESLVALVILSTVFAVTWQWFGVAATSTTKIERNLILPDAFRALVAQLEQENLQQKRRGSFQYKDLKLNWEATVKRHSKNEYLRRQPAWIVVLLTIGVDVQTIEGQSITTFNFDLNKHWRDPEFKNDGLFQREN